MSQINEKLKSEIINLPIFQKMIAKNQIKQMQQCLLSVQYIQMSKGSTVFFKGAWPKEFFIILDGQVNVLYPKETDKINRQKDKFKATAKQIDNRIRNNDNTNLFNCTIKELNHELSIDDLDYPEKYFESGIFKYHTVNILRKGQTFGETGLLLMQGRSATVLCTKDTSLLTLIKEDYDHCLLEIHQSKLQKKSKIIEFALSYNMIKQINCFHKIHLSRNNFLFQEGEKSHFVYIIKKGEVQILKYNSKLKKTQKVSVISTISLIGLSDVMQKKKRQYSVQILSSTASFYKTDKYQFRGHEIQTSNQDKNLQKNFQNFANVFLFTIYLISHQTLLKTKQIQMENINTKAGVLRSTVKDIDYYYESRQANMQKQTDKIAQRKIYQNEVYGAVIVDKLDKMESLIKKAYMPKEIDNDAYIQAFDKVGIEKRLKKLKLRRKILGKDQEIKNQMQLHKYKIKYRTRVISTRDRLKLKKEIESGAYRQRITKMSSKQNRSWGDIISSQYQEKSKNRYDQFCQHNNSLTDDVNYPLDYSILQTFFPPSSARNTNEFSATKRIPTHPKSTQRPVTSTSSIKKVASLNHIKLSEVNLLPSPVFGFSRTNSETKFFYSRPQTAKGNQPQILKQSFVSLKTQSKQIVMSDHNMYRFSLPMRAQVSLLKKRFQKK